MDNTGHSGSTMNSTLQGSFIRVKEQHKLLHSGLSSVAGKKPQNVMMDAIVVAKMQDDQKAHIENRIIKLRREEEKATKRIRDLQRQQKFREEQNDEKYKRMTQKANFRAHLQNVEDENRRKFNADRKCSQSRIQQSMERTFFSNKSTYNDLKDQQIRINDLVQNNNLNFLRERQEKFQKIKTDQVRAKSLFNTMSAMNVQNLKGNYEQRVQDKQLYAQQTQDFTKQLEQEEAQLLQRLQKTYQTERKLTDTLNEVCEKSPVKQKAQKKSDTQA